MKKYKNYLNNQHERKRLEGGGCTSIKIRNGEAVSYTNKQGEIIQKKAEKTVK